MKKLKIIILTGVIFLIVIITSKIIRAEVKKKILFSIPFGSEPGQIGVIHSKDGIVPYGQFVSPPSFYVRRGKIYIMDTLNFRILIFFLTGKLIDSIDIKIVNHEKRPNYTTDIVVDLKGNIYFSDTTNCNIVKLDSNADFLMGFGKKGKISKKDRFVQIDRIFVDIHENIVAVDYFKNRKAFFDSKGRFIMDLKPEIHGVSDFKGRYYSIRVQNRKVVINRYINLFLFPDKYIELNFASPVLSFDIIGFDKYNNIYLKILTKKGYEILKYSEQGKFVNKFTTSIVADICENRQFSVDEDGTVYHMFNLGRKALITSYKF